MGHFVKIFIQWAAMTVAGRGSGFFFGTLIMISGRPH